MRIAAVLTALMMVSLAGCLSGGDDDVDSTTAPVERTSVYERHGMEFNFSGPYGAPLVEGTYDITGPFEAYVPVDLPLSEGGGAISSATQDENGDGILDGVQVHLAYWLPDVPEGTQVPVFADIGPYYEGEDGAAAPSYAKLFMDTLLPHGYAIAQVSVLGTGKSNHCMDLMGHAEQLGIDAAISWLGTQDWSNGNVGLFGASYDGSTQWEAAAMGNPHLKTIFPTSGLIGMYELMWRNGSAETRGPIMHNVVYGQFGVDQDTEDWQNACVDYAAGLAQGGGAFAWGSSPAPEYNNYWEERYFLDRALTNYEGSVYLIQGLQDWNVDNHMAFPTHHLLEDAGFEVRGLYGQWAHAFPTSTGSMANQGEGRGAEAYPDSPRFDWQQDVLEWLDYYLYERGERPPLHAEVQSRDGTWRVEQSFPPRDANRVELPLADGPALLPSSSPYGTNTNLVYETEAFTSDTHISGNVYLEVDATPAGDGGQIYVRLDTTDGERIGHGIMNLRYHEGGKEPEELTPGETIPVRVELFALDAVVPAGKGLQATIATHGEDYLPPAQPTNVQLANMVLDVPTIDRDGSTEFEPPLWWEIVTFDSLDPIVKEGFRTGCGLGLPSAVPVQDCPGLEQPPGSESRDGYWIDLEEEHKERLFRSSASFQGSNVRDTDCYFTDDDGEVVGAAFNGAGPCAGRIPEEAEWLYVYGYQRPIDSYEMTFTDEEMVRKGTVDQDE